MKMRPPCFCNRAARNELHDTSFPVLAMASSTTDSRQA
jgi:hypothetical protein